MPPQLSNTNTSDPFERKGYPGTHISRFKQILAMMLAQSCWNLGFSKSIVTLAGRFSYVPANSRCSILPIARRKSPAFPILIHHRFTIGQPDPFFPAIPISAFEAQIRFLKRYYEIAPLDVLVKRLFNRDFLSRNTLAITFDDGYADNYRLAHAVLKKYHVPATVFLTTNFVDQLEAPWNDQVAYAVKNTDETSLEIKIDGQEITLDMDTELSRLAALDFLLLKLRRISHQEKVLAIQDIFTRLNVQDFSALTGTMLTWDQVRSMKRDGITFGAHTVTHPILTRVSAEESAREMSDSRLRIETEIDDAVDLFAYPNGGTLDFDDSHKRLAREAGFKAAFTTLHGLNETGTDPYEFRRGGPYEQTLPEFALKLAAYRFLN